jgi:hypothetical protein
MGSTGWDCRSSILSAGDMSSQCGNRNHNYNYDYKVNYNYKSHLLLLLLLQL